MSSPDLGPILEELAAGRIDAAEAARRIDALKAAAAPTESAASTEELPPRRQYSPHARDVFEAATEEQPASGRRRQPTQGVDRISVRAVGRRVRIIGDATVATASAEGPHVLRRNGAVLEVTSDGELGPSLDGFSILRPPRNLDDLRSLGLGKELLLRINRMPTGGAPSFNVPKGCISCFARK